MYACVFPSCTGVASVVPAARLGAQSQMTITDYLFGVCDTYTHTHLCL